MPDLAAGTMAERGLVLLVRSGAWGLPTACPACLPVYIYLKLARVAFTPQHATFQPDSDDLPVLEHGDIVGYGSDSGGIVGVLRRENICDLDEGLSDSAKADLNAYTSIVDSWLSDALLYELWLKENEATVSEVYLSSIPWPINKAINWKQRRSVQTHLGITTENIAERSAELSRRAAAAYEALSVRLQEQDYFIAGKPTSLDAVVLGHILFLQHAPLEVSFLKVELNKHRNLVVYSQNMKNKLLGDLSPTIFPPPKSYSPPAGSYASSSSRGTTAQNGTKAAPKKRTEKEKLFRKRAKYFIIAQVAAVLLYVVFAGIEVEVEGLEDEGGVDD